MENLSIRLTGEQKFAVKNQARTLGMSMNNYILRVIAGDIPSFPSKYPGVVLSSLQERKERARAAGSPNGGGSDGV